jgi:hypothetical protein
MINPGTYENLSENLQIASENLINSINISLVKLIKEVIKNPRNLSRLKKIYEDKIKRIIKTFSVEAKNWIEKDLTNSYLIGLKSADKIINNFGGTISENEIINGSFLVKNMPPAIAPIPEIPGQIILQFKEFTNHIEPFGVFRAAAYYNISKIQIVRSTDDIYRKISTMVFEREFQEGNMLTRRNLSQRLLNEYNRNGITSIVYKNGRRVPIDNYCEMLGRTMTGRCSLQASLNRYQERGYDLGIVSAHFRACDLCTPYEGIILSLDGKDSRYPTIFEAEGQGLFHPNCKHDISPFFEGITPELDIKVDRAEQVLIDEYGYKEAQKIAYTAQQKQRYIERNIRKYKRKETLSLDERIKTRNKYKVSDWQSKQREHLKENTFLRRDYSREQIKRAH